MVSINRLVMEHAIEIADQVGARALLLYADMAGDASDFMEKKHSFDIVVVTRGEEMVSCEQISPANIINVPNVRLTRIGYIKIAITKGIAAGLFKKGDVLVCLTGVRGLGYLDTILMIDVGREFEILTSEKIPDMVEEVRPEVFGAVLSIALELAAQGRAGRKVGTIFVIGDHEKVMHLSRQMIINPFMGYPEEERNILNPELRETIKELSAIDGCFVVTDAGTVVTAGRHLSAALERKDFPQGLGSRHIAAAGITSVTKAVAVVLSESTGNVSIFKNGRIFVNIEKPTE